MNNDKLIPISKASEMLGVSINTLRKWDACGKLPAIKLSGNHRRYSLSTINEMIGNKEQELNNNNVVAIYCRVS